MPAKTTAKAPAKTTAKAPAKTTAKAGAAKAAPATPSTEAVLGIIHDLDNARRHLLAFKWQHDLQGECDHKAKTLHLTEIGRHTRAIGRALNLLEYEETR